VGRVDVTAAPAMVAFMVVGVPDVVPVKEAL
jgi:hypothetical protein